MTWNHVRRAVRMLMGGCYNSSWGLPFVPLKDCKQKKLHGNRLGTYCTKQQVFTERATLDFTAVAAAFISSSGLVWVCVLQVDVCQEAEVLQAEKGAVPFQNLSVPVPLHFKTLPSCCWSVGGLSQATEEQASGIWNAWVGLQIITKQGYICASAGMYITWSENKEAKKTTWTT